MADKIIILIYRYLIRENPLAKPFNTCKLSGSLASGLKS